MKPLQNQYQDLLEGKMSKFNFLTNIKRSLPHLVSNVTSFEDAVKILKNKRILSEVETKTGKLKFSDLKKGDIIQNKFSGTKYTIINVTDRTADIQQGDDGKKVEIATLNNYELWKGKNESLREIKPSINNFDFIKKSIESASGDKVEKREEDEEGDPLYWSLSNDNVNYYIGSNDQIIKYNGETGERYPIGKLEHYDNNPDDKDYDEEIINRYEREQEKHALPGGHLKESVEMPANLVADIDKVNPLEYRTGLDYELDLSGDFSAESLIKCAKKVVKNLKKNSIYYTDLKAELTQKINNKKVVSSEYTEIKKDNQIDKLNQLKSIVKKEIANTKTSLSKQEKASKAMPKGVKLMKEEKEQKPKLSAEVIQNIIQKSGGPRKNSYHTEDLKNGMVYVISRTNGILNLYGDAKRNIEKYFDIEERSEKVDDDRYYYEYFIKPNPNKPYPVQPKADVDLNTDDIFENSEKERQEKDFSKFSDKMIGKKHTAVNAIKDKIKTYVTNQLKKEAVKFTIGSEKEYVSDAESRGFEDKLRKAGVTKFTKSKVQ